MIYELKWKMLDHLLNMALLDDSSDIDLRVDPSLIRVCFDSRAIRLIIRHD